MGGFTLKITIDLPRTEGETADKVTPVSIALAEITDAKLRGAHLAAFDGEAAAGEEGGEEGGEEEEGRRSAIGVWREQKVWTRGIWLHAWKYKSKDDSWSFEAPLPPWAREDFEWMDLEARAAMMS